MDCTPAGKAIMGDACLVRAVTVAGCFFHGGVRKDLQPVMEKEPRRVGWVVGPLELLGGVEAVASSSSQEKTRPATRTASRCTAQTARGTHVFDINDYSLHKGLGKGKFIQSAAFDVGGYSWRLRYYPDGDPREESADHISVYLELLSHTASVRANYDLKLLDWTTGSASSVLCDTVKFSTVFLSENIYTWGKSKFMKKSELEASPSVYLRDDCLVIHCDITIVNEPKVGETIAVAEDRLPRKSDLPDDFAKLLESGEGADVTFQVQGEAFNAHRIVLAARSPVFKAQLYRLLRQDNRGFITIEDMQPGVFKALLQFIYTDSLPDIKDVEFGEIHDVEDLAKHLLVAADKYALERLKLVCTDMLCKSLNVQTVAHTLALAELHGCSELKDACVEYIMASDRIGDVVASPGYQHLKNECPIVFISLWERTTQLLENLYGAPYYLELESSINLI
ncbi:hypothetical protein EJB05_08954, partial [Eragrostis curvula]